MKTVFNRTLTSMFKPINIIIYFVLVLASILLVSLSVVFSFDSSYSIEVLKLNVIGIFVLWVFIWLCGILLNIFITAIGSGIFASEESEGTMRILLAKPLSREEVIFGKILGIICGSFIYMVVSLILAISIFSLIVWIDTDVLKVLVGYLPKFILYGLFVICFFTGITSLLSSLFKKRVPAIIIMIIFVLLSYGIFPIVRNITYSFGKSYERYHLYLIDTNYHMGSIYFGILDINEDLKLSPTFESPIGIFTGRYVYAEQDPDLQNQSDFYSITSIENNLINKNVVILIYSIIFVGAYTLCYIRMKKKDIT